MRPTRLDLSATQRLHGRTHRRRTISSREPYRASLRIDVLTLIAEIDHTTATWNNTHGLTPKALRELATRKWTPEETGKVEAVADTIEKWIAAAAQILNDATASVPLRLPCPACSKLWTYHRTGTERIRTYAPTRYAQARPARPAWPAKPNGPSSNTNGLVESSTARRTPNKPERRRSSIQTVTGSMRRQIREFMVANDL
jgi:hypothetical protein